MLVCPKCKNKYRDGFSVCSNCETQLVEQTEEHDKNDDGEINKSLNWLKGFGNITAQSAIVTLFYLGIMPLALSSFFVGKNIYLTNQYLKDISYLENGMQWYTQTEVNNLPLGLFMGIAIFLFGVLTWKIICELLIIIFRCFETYVQKNKQQ